jgi:lysophospholipase L1-like esterase
MKIAYRLAGICLVAFLAQATRVEAAEWVGTWGAAPLPPGPVMGPGPAPQTKFSNQTLRQIVRISTGGNRVRIRFTNEYGTKPLTIGAARVALVDASGNVNAEGGKPVLFAGKPSVTIPAGAPFFSDPVEISAKSLSSLAISLYVPGDTGECTCHAVGLQRGQVSDTGDFTAKNFTPKGEIQSRAFISGVDVESAVPAKTIVVLGDSISDGVGSTLEKNKRWPDLLAERLAARGTAKGWGIVNMGISGNRVLADGAGVSALARFDRDVLAVTGVAYVIVFEGVNDLGMGYGKFESGPMAELFKALQAGQPKPTAESMIAGYRQIIQRAHARGVKVVGATIAPYGGAMYFQPEGEAVRQAINQWIKTGGEFDAVLDFDATFRDPAKPTEMAAALHSGDHLHGSDAGYEAVAKSIDLAIFK